MGKKPFESRPGVSEHAPMRASTKIFLAGRRATIVWMDDDMSRGEFLILFANEHWLRVHEDVSGREFVCPRESVWRIYPHDTPAS